MEPARAASIASCDDTEQTLDMTQASRMAPGLTGTVSCYVGSTDTAILSAMTTHTPLRCAIELFVGLDPGGPQH